MHSDTPRRRQLGRVLCVRKSIEANVREFVIEIAGDGVNGAKKSTARSSLPPRRMGEHSRLGDGG